MRTITINVDEDGRLGVYADEIPAGTQISVELDGLLPSGIKHTLGEDAAVSVRRGDDVLASAIAPSGELVPLETRE
jgi:hypothetical protein